MTTNVPHPSQDAATRYDNREEKLDRRRAQVAAMTDCSPAQSTIMDEKPVHLTVAYLLASGRTRKEISAVTGLTLTTLSSLTRQPWFVARLKEITEAAGKDMVRSFLEGEVVTSLEVLRDLRDDQEQKGPTRLAAANSLLDRFLGKPTVHVESTTALNIHSAADAKDQVQSELEKVEAELKRLGVTSANSRS
jgi:hypothetical protein